ncbi:SCO3374 family protein [Streptomyces caelestis]|uniref:Proline-rich protein n=1 Tax=Streptomyces caelestis TaxID=36816 RepID=A0A7W9H6I6_9ACTN|nr:SCO3374 family protein [Streptomyces caelestis]MBB5796597.1 hypothetical protein [Streptomyces caelestis]GGW40176.1 hypothetical protein GCM10010320_19590 [Streptomyces caelestis]
MFGAPRPIPLPRRPLDASCQVRRWYENELGWPTVPGDPLRLAVGVRYDVLDVPAEAGHAALRRLELGSPVAVLGDRMRLLVAPGSAEELPGLLEWLEWGALPLDLAAIGAGGAMEAPRPPGMGVPSGSGRGGLLSCEAGGLMSCGRDGLLRCEANAPFREPDGSVPRESDGPLSCQTDAPPFREPDGSVPRESDGPLRCEASAPSADERGWLLPRQAFVPSVPEADRGSPPAPGSSRGRPLPLGWFGSQGAAVWLRPPEPGCEVKTSLPTLSALGGGGDAPDLVRLVNTVATQCHRLRLRRVCAQPPALRAQGR